MSKRDTGFHFTSNVVRLQFFEICIYSTSKLLLWLFLGLHSYCSSVVVNWQCTSECASPIFIDLIKLYLNNKNSVKRWNHLQKSYAKLGTCSLLLSPRVPFIDMVHLSIPKLQRSRCSLRMENYIDHTLKWAYDCLSLQRLRLIRVGCLEKIPWKSSISCCRDMATIPHYWLFVKGVYWSPVDSANGGPVMQIFHIFVVSLICFKSTVQFPVLWYTLTVMWRQWPCIYRPKFITYPKICDTCKISHVFSI